MSPCPENFSPNTVIHDSIDVLGTLGDATANRKFYHAMRMLIDEKIKLARYWAGANAAQVININLGTRDEEKYTSQTREFFSHLQYALENGIVIQTTIVAPVCLNSWVGKLLTRYSTPGFRRVMHDAHHYYYIEDKDIYTNKIVRRTDKIIIPTSKLANNNLADIILTQDERIEILTPYTNNLQINAIHNLIRNIVCLHTK